MVRNIFITFLNFFRDPLRSIPSDKSVVVAPADGKVVKIEYIDDPNVGESAKYIASALMRILILGAGVIGVSTAYELLRAGHDVTVIDRKSEPALETSYGNAGLIAPGHSYAWTTPKLPKNLFKSLYEKKRTFRFKFQWDLAMWRWGLQFIRHCTKKKMG